MKGLIAWFASNPVAANLLMFFVIAAGCFSASSVRQEVYPAFAFDFIAISVPYPGASPDEVEEAVCVRIEEAIHGLKGIDRISSRAAEGFGTIWAQLALDADPRRVLERIQTRVDSLDTLPAGAASPIVQELIDDSVLISVAVHGHVDERTLRAAGERVRDGISDLPEVSRAELVGLRPYELAIEVSEADLRRYGLSFDDVVRAVRASSLDLPGGELKTEGGEILMRAKSQAYRGEEFERLVLFTQSDGTRLLLGDVATVIDGFAETDEKVRFDGRPAAIVRLLASEPENVLVISEAVRAHVDRTRGTLPEGVELAIWSDESLEFQSRRNLLLRNGAQGLFLILAVLALFLRLRLALWVSVGIPISFLGALIVLAVVDVSLNMMSLFAFIVALGLVVDDAIIVGENVARHQRGSKDRLRAAIEGTNEVAVPVTVAVLTTVFFLLPILDLPTVVGKVAMPLGVVTIACLVFSVVEALFVLPAHLAGVDDAPGPTRGPLALLARVQRRVDAALERFIETRYRPCLRGALRWPYLTLSLAGVALMLTVAAVAGGWVRESFLPNIEHDFVNARVEMPDGTPPEVMERVVGRLEAHALALGDELAAGNGGDAVHRHVLTSIGDDPDRHNDMQDGGDGPNVGRVAIGLVPGEERRVTSLQVEERWRERVGGIPGALSLGFSGSDMGLGADVDVSLSGADRDVLVRAAKALEVELSSRRGVREVATSLAGGKQELQLRLRPEADAMGLTLSELVRQVHQGFHGEEVQRVQRGRDQVAVVARYPARERRSLADLENMRIRMPGGGELPFPAVAHAELGSGYAAITRRDRRSEVGVTADVDDGLTSEKEVHAQLVERVLPDVLSGYPGVTYDFFGSSREENELNAVLWRYWLMAFIASYALLAVPLRSYLQPLLILLAVPFGLVGGVAGHALLGFEFSSFSLIGLVALTGVVINDALVLIDRANRRRREGLSVAEALEDAGATRFRAIVLTSLTTFFGLLPLLFERSGQAAWLKPMAVALGFGVVFATAITLVLLPAAYAALEGAIARFRASGAASRRRETQKHRQASAIPASPVLP